MFNRESEFFKLSKGVVERFLQSAVIVDDRADFEKDPGDILSTRLIAPSRRSQKRTGPQSRETAVDDEMEPSNGNDGANRLDAKKVIDSFAQKGIVCSILRPYQEEMETLTDTLEKLGNCADIVVIDWTLYGDDGQKALEMVERIVKSSAGNPAQLRLIVIYTINPDIAGIARRIYDRLKVMAEADVTKDGKATVQEENDGFTLTFGAARITVLAKHDVGILKQYRRQVVAFEDLADRVTEEFTAMTAGLVSNVVLESLAEIRKNTHRILSQFSLDLDAPYLTHRALLGTPDEAEDLLTTLIAEELQAILEETRVGSRAGLKAIETWIEARKDKGVNFSLPLKDGNKVLTTIAGDRVVELLRKGIEQTVQELDELTRRQKKEILRSVHKLPLTVMFHADDASSESLDEKFAFVTSMRAYYEHVPKLTLGTILKEESEDEPSYWICIQPRCDCVRIDSVRVFPFLPLRAITGGGFDIILKEKDTYPRLLHKKKPYELKLVKFQPRIKDKGVVTAKRDGDTFYFQSAGNCKYTWIGELRQEQAQRLSNQFAATLSRVGLDESEWLRLWATRG